jgi:diguanylate cyclase (GGDEF)-like protein
MFIGLFAQIGITALLWLFFLLLKQHAGRRSRFFKFWTLAWAVLLAALLPLAAGLYWLPHLGAQDGAMFRVLIPGMFLLYQVGKPFFLLLLLAGSLEYVNGRLPKQLPFYGSLAALAYGLVSFSAAADSWGLMQWQALACIAVPLYSGVRLLGLPPTRRTLGSRMTGIVFMLYALLWCMYWLALYQMHHLPANQVASFAGLTANFNGYLDSLLELLLAFGMVLMILEEGRRETNAAHAELAVAHEKLLHESLTDPLTATYNRLAFTRGVFLQTAGSTYGSVFIFDLDNLKHVNDSHGHEAGDELLKYFVMTLRGGLRPADQLYRWGGDEFLLLLPGATYANVAPRLNQLLHKALPLSMFDGSVNLKLEASVGGADYHDQESLRTAVSNADRAMYEQKRIHKTAPQPAASDIGDVAT